jgi:hypothetical protein
MHKFLAGVLMNAGCALFAAASVASQEPPGTWVLVTAPAFRAGLQPLIEHRRAEGLNVAVIETTNALTPEQIRGENGDSLRNHIRELKGANPTYVLLAGAPSARNLANAEQIALPPLLGTTGRMQGQPSDFGYCLPDTNGAPEIAVGRFPARTREEARAMVEKTLDLESGRSAGEWQHRLLLLAGDSGGGPLADMIVESVISPWLKELDASWSVSAIFSSPGSRFYLPGKDTRNRFLSLLEEGSLFSIFLGHSAPEGMCLTGNYGVSRKEWAEAHIRQGAGVFFTCGCWACRFSGGTNDGYGLAAMRNPNGPAAVIGASAESYTFAGELTTAGLARCLRKEPFPSRLGDYWRAAQMGLAKGEMNEFRFKLYDMFDGTQGKIPVAVQRLEHLEMWMLLGDPALRLPLPVLEIRLETPGSVQAGSSLLVKGVLPKRLAGTTVRLTLERPIDSKPDNLEPLPEFSSTNGEAIAQIATANHQKANSFILAAVDVKPSGEAFSSPIDAPAQLPWSNLVIRASALSTNELVMGVSRVSVTHRSK